MLPLKTHLARLVAVKRENVFLELVLETTLEVTNNQKADIFQTGQAGQLAASIVERARASGHDDAALETATSVKEKILIS